MKSSSSSKVVEFPTVDFVSPGESVADVVRKQKNKDKKKKSGGFQSMGLSPAIFKAVMKMGYKVPTPIQRKAIPEALSGRDIVAMGRTGSGKTAAFLIPLFEKLKTHSTGDVRGVILSPTRELALQTFTFAKALGKFTNLRFCLLLGGASMELQFGQLSKSPDLIIATPGRMMHHLIEVKFSLRVVQVCIFDEADRLFEMGFAAQLKEILGKMGDQRQTMLFSATMPKSLVEFTRAGLNNPITVRLDVEVKISPKLKMLFMTVRKEQKSAALAYLFKSIIPSEEKTIVFVATRHHVEYMRQLLDAAGIECTFVYGQLDAAARKINIAKFRNNLVPVLIVTDVAARGIDIPLLDNVINYDFPAKPKLFVHRVGRAARAGRSGRAFSFVEPTEVPYMVDLHLFLGSPLLNTPKDKKRKQESEESTQLSGAGDDQVFSDKDVYYGCFPVGPLEQEQEFVEKLHSKRHIASMVKVITRAYQMYYKTRGKASSSSARRAKLVSFPDIEMHPDPIFAAAISTGDAKQDELNRQSRAMIDSIRGYKNESTIMELNDRKNFAMMKKRKVHDSVIKRDIENKAINKDIAKLKLREANEDFATKGDEDYDEDYDEDDNEDEDEGENGEESEGSEFEDDDFGVVGGSSANVSAPVERTAPAKVRMSKAERKRLKKQGANQAAASSKATSSTKKRKFRDNEHFITMQPTDDPTERGLRISEGFGERLSDLVMEVTGEDAQSMNQAKRMKLWDNKKKKFVQQVVGGDPFFRQRNEAGELISKKHGKDANLYNQWKAKNKIFDNAHAASGGMGARFGDEDEDDRRTGGRISKNSARGRKKIFNSRQQAKANTKEINSANVKSELVGADQMRKELKRKNREAGWKARVSGRGGRGGGGGRERGGGGRGRGGRGRGRGRGR